MLAEWRRRQRSRIEPHEPASRGAWEAVGAGEARGRPCEGGEHTDGRWVAKAAGEMEGGSHIWGKWEITSRAFFTPAPRYGGSCEKWVDEYAWEPARCALATWDARAFCAALGGRSLGFVGDSTMMQVSLVLCLKGALFCEPRSLLPLLQKIRRAEPTSKPRYVAPGICAGLCESQKLDG